MTKFTVTSFILLLTLCFTYADSGRVINLKAKQTGIDLVSKKSTGFTARVEVAALRIPKSFEGNELYSRIEVPGFVSSKNYGNPNLPTLNKLIEIPYAAEINVRILSYTEETYNLKSLGINELLSPAQPSISKSTDPSDVPFLKNSSVYLTNSYVEDELVICDELGTMRGVNLGRLVISPFSYNPVSNTLKVRNNIEFEIEFTNADFDLTNAQKTKFYSPVFNSAFGNIINYTEPSIKDAISTYPIKYVIVSDPAFETVLQGFVEWKTKKGFTVIEAYTDDPLVGSTTSSIKNYLAGLYNNASASDPAPTYLLIVGDVAQVPTFSGSAGSHVTDLYYCEYDGGNDFYPEIYYGRFSATNIEELQPQIDKTLEYEQYLMPNPSFLDTVVLVAGVDANNASTYGNGQINYGTDNYFNQSHNIYSNTYLYPASGNSAAAIISDVSEGCSFANYTAHCSASGWADPSFTTSDVPSLNNAGQYPLMVGNCCSSVEFQQNECFGEAVLRAENKGALGYIGGSNSTYWNEDYWWGVGNGSISANPTYLQTGLGAYDRTFHENGETELEWFITQGQMVNAGNLAVTEAAGAEHYYWEIYHLMGDPSLMVYFSVPSTLNMSYNQSMVVGSTSLTVNAEPHTYVAISMNGILLDAQLVDSTAMVTLQFPAFSTPGNALIVGTKQNRQPHIDTISIIPSNAPYVSFVSCTIDDSNENNNSQADFSETIFLDVTLGNLGLVNATNISAKISSSDPNITILNDSAFWGNINSNSDLLLTNAFEIKVDDIINDAHNVSFVLESTGDSSVMWTSYFNLQLHAPVLSVPSYTIIDTAGNNNGRMDPGETVTILYSVENTGSIESPSATVDLQCSSLFINIINANQAIGTLSNSTDFDFEIEINPAIAQGIYIDFSLNVEANGYTANRIISLPVGLIVEDWETNDFTSFNWSDDGDKPWEITGGEVYEGSFSAQSGDIQDEESSELILEAEFASSDSISFYKKVSCEEGGTWWGTYYYYDFLEFFIDGVSMGKWDGEVDWSRESFAVSSGQHTFRWIYSKDQMTSSGDDRAYIDFIVLPQLAGINYEPAFISSPVTETWVDSVYSYDIVTVDANSDDTLILNADQLPGWLSFTDNGDGTGTLQGIPAISDAGFNDVQISVTDNNIPQAIVQNFQITVNDLSRLESIELNSFKVFPNPMSGFSIIQYSVSDQSDIQLNIEDISGKNVKTILNKSSVESGNYSLKLYRKNLQSGVYFLKLTQNSNTEIIKLIIK